MDNVDIMGGEELHQQIFAALTIGHRTMVGSGPGQWSHDDWEEPRDCVTGS